MWEFLKIDIHITWKQKHRKGQASWMMSDNVHDRTGLMPRPLPWKAERGSDVLNNISCHMGRGLRRKKCHIYIVHPGLKFSDDLDCCTVWFTKMRTSCEVSFFYLQFGSKYDRLRHAHIIMRSRIWFELSDRGATLPHVTKKLLRTPDPLSRMCGEGLGTRLFMNLPQYMQPNIC